MGIYNFKPQFVPFVPFERDPMFTAAYGLPKFRDRAGADFTEWPNWAKIQEFPQ